jgi:hypothetical protein
MRARLHAPVDAESMAVSKRCAQRGTTTASLLPNYEKLTFFVIS